MKFSYNPGFLALVALALPAAAFAEENGPLDLEGQVSVTSDYRFRGVSLSGNDPVPVGEVTVSHPSGFYASAWVSNVDLGDETNTIETDFTLGWSGEIYLNLSVDAGVVHYTYPDRNGLNYTEVYSSLGTTISGADLELGVAYAPKQGNIDNRSNTYVYLSTDVPLGQGPVTARAAIGFEDGAFANDKVDWRLGLSYDLGSGFLANLDYVDTVNSQTALGKSSVVASLTWRI